VSSLTCLPPYCFVERSSVVELHGEVDLLAAPELRAVLDRAIDRWRVVAVDLRPCAFLDCCGLAALVAARDRADREDKRLAVVCGRRDPAQRLFDLAVPGFVTFPDLATAADADPDAALRRWTSGTA
jgi:anti-anti-sigma factor